MARNGIVNRELALVIEEAKKLGIPKVMITCDKKNSGSAKVIINNGGVLEWEGYNEPTKEVIQIYWIQIDNQ
jgi:predicted acetyltransferase